MKTQIIVSKENIDSNKFITPYGNRGNNKPNSGGFWTSSITENNKSAWIEFTEAEGFYEDTSELMKFKAEVSKDARVLLIDSEEDYEKALETYGMPVDRMKNPLAMGVSHILDFEKLMKDYDALSLTQRGMYRNRDAFYGWDCESTIWFNMGCFESIQQM